jgi:hypothetical protein
MQGILIVLLRCLQSGCKEAALGCLSLAGSSGLAGVGFDHGREPGDDLGVGEGEAVLHCRLEKV